MRGLGWLMLGVVFVAACARQPDAQAIRAAITAMAQAAEARRGSDVLAHVDDDFIGNEGGYDRAGLDQLLRAQFLVARGIGVQLGSIDVELSGDRATARFDVRLDDASGRWLVERDVTLQLVTGWRREGNAWRCYNARWSNDPR